MICFQLSKPDNSHSSLTDMKRARGRRAETDGEEEEEEEGDYEDDEDDSDEEPSTDEEISKTQLIKLNRLLIKKLETRLSAGKRRDKSTEGKGGKRRKRRRERKNRSESETESSSEREGCKRKKRRRERLQRRKRTESKTDSKSEGEPEVSQISDSDSEKELSKDQKQKRAHKEKNEGIIMQTISHTKDDLADVNKAVAEVPKHEKKTIMDTISHTKGDPAGITKRKDEKQKDGPKESGVKSPAPSDTGTRRNVKHLKEEDAAKEAADEKVAKESASGSKEEARKREEIDPKKKLKNEEHTREKKSHSSLNLHCDKDDINFFEERSKNDIATICLRGKSIHADMEQVQSFARRALEFDIKRMTYGVSPQSVRPCLYYNLATCTTRNVHWHHYVSKGSSRVVYHICAICHAAVNLHEAHTALKCPQAQIKHG